MPRRSGRFRHPGAPAADLRSPAAARSSSCAERSKPPPDCASICRCGSHAPARARAHEEPPHSCHCSYSRCSAWTAQHARPPISGFLLTRRIRRRPRSLRIARGLPAPPFADRSTCRPIRLPPMGARWRPTARGRLAASSMTSRTGAAAAVVHAARPTHGCASASSRAEVPGSRHSWPT